MDNPSVTPRVSLRKQPDSTETIKLYGKEYIKAADGELYPVEDNSARATDSFSQQNPYRSFKIQLQPDAPSADEQKAEFAEPRSFPEVEVVQSTPQTDTKTKYCRYCGKKILQQAVVCTHCGLQVEELRQAQPNVVTTNVNITPAPVDQGKRCNKWIALLLCVLFGWCGAHNFYQGKNFKGVLYILTFFGICGLLPFIDFWILLFKPTHYYVK